MSYLVVDRNGNEIIFKDKPKYDCFTDSWLIIRDDMFVKVKDNTSIDTAFDDYRYEKYVDKGIRLPKGTIEKIIGKKMNIKDEPYELK